LTRKIYGEISFKHKLEYSTKIEDYRNCEFYPSLKKIYDELVKNEGNNNFVKQNKLREADVFIDSENCLLELDEPQHFTKARKIALLNYPDNLELGFDRKQWMDLCDKIDAHDSDIHRDTNRAWYDTLRDFAPFIIKTKPTIRLYLGEIEYCLYNPNSEVDVLKFQSIITFKETNNSENIKNNSIIYDKETNDDSFSLSIEELDSLSPYSNKELFNKIEIEKEKNTQNEEDILTLLYRKKNKKDKKMSHYIAKSKTFDDYTVSIKSDNEPKISRIIICWKWKGDLNEAYDLLQNIAKIELPKTDYMITCGGFIKSSFKDQIVTFDNKEPPKQIIDSAISEATQIIHTLLDNDLKEKLKKNTKYLTLGIDLEKEFSFNKIELVAVINLQTDEIHFTGKSYPVCNQQKTLIRITDYDSHFITLNGESVLILGCHDLTVFNKRAEKSAGFWRSNIQKEFKNRINIKKPTIVLQHPHTTSKKRTWISSWSELNRICPEISNFASAGLYFDPKHRERDNLDEILNATHKGNVLNIIVERY